MSRRIRAYAAAVLLAGSAGAIEKPMLSSPGATHEALLIAESCPTFHWGSIADASDFELVVYQVDQPSAEPILRQSLPGSVVAWAPSLDRCLAPGGTFAWSIRAEGADAESAWSEPNLFRVATLPEVKVPEADGAGPLPGAAATIGAEPALLAADHLAQPAPPSQPKAEGLSNAEGAVTVGEEAVRIVRGGHFASGFPFVGEGFTVIHTAGSGIYRINFDTAFADVPAVVATPLDQAASTAHLSFIDKAFFTVQTRDSASALEDIGLTWIAVGK